jgi:excisionase family DNA binding protein
MSEEKLLTVREVSMLLEISEKEVLDLAENGSLPAYKVGGVFLRFKKEQVIEYKRKIKPLSSKPRESEKRTFQGRFNDFFYFNDFYILASLIIILLLLIIFRG